MIKQCDLAFIQFLAFKYTIKMSYLTLGAIVETFSAFKTSYDYPSIPGFWQFSELDGHWPANWPLGHFKNFWFKTPQNPKPIILGASEK